MSYQTDVNNVEETNETSASPTTQSPEKRQMISGKWRHPATIQLNNFAFKSLSNWSFNTCIGCCHGCRFCYVPETATNKQAGPLKILGVSDPDAEWGDYVFVREWDEKKFLSSLFKAENTAREELHADGNRAVMFCTTTDPYQVIRNGSPVVQKILQTAHEHMVSRALELILEKSTLNVRILTRSPLARKDFDLMKRFGHRLLFGMSLPTLDEKLARIYEPNAPSPGQRLKTLEAAKKAGLHVYVAVAPTYPECGDNDLRATLKAVKGLDPVTVFHEPINIRAENVKRISEHAATLGVKLNTDVFDGGVKWRRYAIGQLAAVERIAGEIGMGDKLHLWPDKTLASESRFLEVRQSAFAEKHPNAEAFQIKAARTQDKVEYETFKAWIDAKHSRISEWPKAEVSHE
ncbi:MAG TPA: radical SAM protein [Terrimicrobiaceae bacterium]|nr:radical SAM protein [Terrimicrobiaceae bacterium]